jgi:cytochrome c oxidase subunit 3
MGAVMSERRASIDVSKLPTITFGHTSLMWWGTAGFMIIEGWTLGLCVMSYFYLRQNLATWPPPRTPNPSLLLPTINLIIMLGSLVPSWWTKKRAGYLDRLDVRKGLLISGILGVIILVVRWYELWAINTRWDTHAYGSAAWLIVGLHMTLILLDVGDTFGLWVLLRDPDVPPHFYSDATDNSNYWYFTILSWVPLYFIVYVGPHIF